MAGDLNERSSDDSEVRSWKVAQIAARRDDEIAAVTARAAAEAAAVYGGYATGAPTKRCEVSPGSMASKDKKSKAMDGLGAPFPPPRSLGASLPTAHVDIDLEAFDSDASDLSQ